MHVTNQPPLRLERDPGCGRELISEQVLLSAELKGHTYLLSSERCRMLFSIRPGWYVDRAGEATRPKVS